MDSFSSGQLTRFVLTLYALFTATLFRLPMATLELLSLFVSIHMLCGSYGASGLEPSASYQFLLLFPVG